MEAATSAINGSLTPQRMAPTLCSWLGRTQSQGSRGGTLSALGSRAAVDSLWRRNEAIYAVHLDHGDEETCYDCINSGFYSSVMIDASHEPFDQNVAITKRVTDRAHAKGISVEAELGMLGGVEEDIKVDEGHACLTNPDFL